MTQHETVEPEQTPVQTDNREREGIDPPQNVSQDPEIDYSQVSQ